MSEIRIGLLGAGQVAQSHVKAITGLPGCRLDALFDPNHDRATALATRVHGARALPSAEAVIAADVDAVVITAPTQEHFALGRTALKAGKHVLMEKPFTRTSAQAGELAEFADRQRLVLMPAQVARFLPAVIALRERSTTEAAGHLVQAVERRFTFRTEVFPWWRDMPEFLISHWGSHSLDIFLWLTGDHAEEVACWASSRQAGYDGIDDFTLVVKTTSDAILSLHQTYSSREELLDWVMVWEHATGAVDNLASSRWNGTPLISYSYDAAMDSAFAAQMAEFIEACAGDRILETTVASLMPTMHALDKAVTAAGIRTT